jgi:riboflavin kinase/FMN adenylyltransferase
MPETKRVIALGFFDGVHLGHAALLNKTKERAKEVGAMPSVLSFDIHPDTLVFGREVPLINSAIGREDIIRRIYGIDNVVFIHFNQRVMHMPWREFVDSIVNELGVVWIVVGYDFTFGDRGEGNSARLSEYCAEHGLGCDVIPAVMKDGEVISSTRIRQLIENGDIAKANELLGHPHMLADTVHSGYHLGTKLGTPTINMYFPEGVLIPRHGVYAAKVVLEDGTQHIAVTNIGVRPTVSDAGRVSVESYILDFSGNLYDRQARVEFYEFLRDEKKFSSYEELSAAIQRDAERTREYFKNSK